MEPETIPTEEIEAEQPGDVVSLPAPSKVKLNGEPHACFDAEEFVFLNARDELLVEYRGMAQRNASVIATCSDLTQVANEEIQGQYDQAKAFRDAYQAQRRQAWLERAMWAVLLVLVQ